MEQQINFGRLTVHLLLQYLNLIPAYYCVDPKHSYFLGCSGAVARRGRAQLYPEDFEGDHIARTPHSSLAHYQFIIQNSQKITTRT
jgi:hypothetical protein